MKRILLSFFALAAATASFAQVCTSDPALSFATAAPGVYPLPVSDGNNATTDRDTLVLCQGQPWEFYFTAVVPDSVTSFSVDLETVGITGISGFPTGISILGAVSPANADGQGVSPTDQIFNDETVGCLSLGGTTSAAAGYYPLTISASVTGSLNLPTTIPGSLFNYQYVLQVSNAPGCVADSNYWISVLSNKNDNLYLATATPNPTNGMTTIEYGTKTDATVIFSVVNMMGEVVYSETNQANKGINTVRFDASQLATGIYFYSISNGAEKTTKRLAVVR